MQHNIFTFRGRVLSKSNSKSFGKHGRYYLSSELRIFEKKVQIQFKKAFPNHTPLKGDIGVVCKFFYKNRKHPDLTNCCKSFFDALNGMLWEDDRQIVRCKLSVDINERNGYEGALIYAIPFDI